MSAEAAHERAQATVSPPPAARWAPRSGAPQAMDLAGLQAKGRSGGEHVHKAAAAWLTVFLCLLAWALPAAQAADGGVRRPLTTFE